MPIDRSCIPPKNRIKMAMDVHPLIVTDGSSNFIIIKIAIDKKEKIVIIIPKILEKNKLPDGQPR